MAANVIAHGGSTAVAEHKVVSFLSDNTNRKQFKRKTPFVKVSYDSGSDADVESDEEQGVSSPSKDDKKHRKEENKSHKRKKKTTHKTSDPERSLDSEEEEHDVRSEAAESDDDTSRVPGAGWADVMAKILGRELPEDIPSVVLAKSKDYQKAKIQEHEDYVQRRKQKTLHYEWENLGRVKPKVTDKETETKLQRIATRGVVQLFNAVKKQQKRFEVKLESTKSERKRIEVESSVRKGDFLDLLKGIDGVSKKNGKNQPTNDSTDSKKWKVLKDDFMMGATMKDWDKQSDSEEDMNGGEDSAVSDSD